MNFFIFLLVRQGNYDKIKEISKIAKKVRAQHNLSVIRYAHATKKSPMAKVMRGKIIR